MAVGINEDGYREMRGITEGSREDKESWSRFLRYLKERGLSGVQLIVSDKCLGLYEVIGDFFPEAKWQCCITSSKAKPSGCTAKKISLYTSSFQAPVFYPKMCFRLTRQEPTPHYPAYTDYYFEWRQEGDNNSFSSDTSKEKL